MGDAPLQHFVGLVSMIERQPNAKKKGDLLKAFWKTYGNYTAPKPHGRMAPDFEVLRLLCPDIDKYGRVLRIAHAHITPALFAHKWLWELCFHRNSVS